MKKKLSKLMIAMLMAIVVVGSLAVSKAAEGDGYYVEPADGYENLSYAGADATLFDVNDTYKGFCIDRDRGHYPTETMYTETAEVITDPNNKLYQVFYYGYGGPEQGGVYTFANDTEAIVATSQAASHFYSSTSSGMNYTRAIENLSADKIPPAHTMSLSHTNMEAYVSGGSQVTDWITLTMDSRLSATATIPDGVTLYIEGDSTGYTGTATVPGGKRFYLSAGATADGIKTVTLKYTGNKMLKINVLAPPNNIYQPVAFFSSLNPSVSVNATFDGKGDLEIIKSSANPDMTDGNDCYSLAGAEYAVYGTYGNAFNDTSRITTITTDANGYGIATGLTLGTYYVKEITAPPGYRLDTSIYTVQVNSPTVATRLSVKDNPGNDPLEIVVRKKDAEEDVYLSGAKFVVKYYDVQMDTDPAEAGYTATRTWYFVTGNEGKAGLLTEYLDSEKTSDAFFYSQVGNPTLPLGTITVQEYEAPEGYIVDDTISVFKITDQQVDTPSVERLNERTITNQVMKQPFEIYKLGESKSGNTPLSGAGFMACNVDDLSKDANGNYIWDSSKAVALTDAGEKELITDESGYALSCPLKYGTYLVRETTVPEGYFGVADFLVTIDENSTTAKTFTLVDESFKAYLKVVKMDALSGKSILDNPATFKIYDYDLKEYVSFDIPTEDGSIKTVDEFKTNESGELITAEPLLPGKYRIEETVCPEGYYGLFTCDIEIAHTGEYETYVTEDGTVTNMGIFFTVTAENNPVPSIKTTAKDSVTGTNVGTVGKAVSIIDTVYYVGLIPGKEYTLKGIVMNTETGEPFLQDGKEVTAELDFKAATSAGSVDLKFEIDSTELHGKSVTVFETLYDGEIAIAVHADIEDKDQTITFPPEEVPPVETPPTGDNFPVVSLIILMCAAVVGIVFVIKKRD